MQWVRFRASSLMYLTIFVYLLNRQSLNLKLSPGLCLYNAKLYRLPVVSLFIVEHVASKHVTVTQSHPSTSLQNKTCSLTHLFLVQPGLFYTRGLLLHRRNTVIKSKIKFSLGRGSSVNISQWTFIKNAFSLNSCSLNIWYGNTKKRSTLDIKPHSLLMKRGCKLVKTSLSAAARTK